MKKICIVILLVAVVAATLIVVAYAAKNERATPEQMILDEIVPQYEWTVYAYNIQKLAKVPADEKEYYAVTFYTDEGKFEFIVAVNGTDVDEELI